MTAGLRTGLLAMVAAFAAVPAPALAQPAGNSASPVAIGPQPLESFSLKGTVTRRAEPVTNAPARPEPQQIQPSAPRAEPRAQASPPAAAATPRASPQRTPPAAPRAQVAEPSRPVTFELPPVGAASGPSAAPQPLRAPAFPPAGPASEALPVPAAGAALGDGMPVSWLFLALLLALGAGYYFFRQRSRTAFAGGGFDIVSPPAPAPSAPPEPKARTVPEPLKRDLAPQGNGAIVSTRLRPWLDIDFTPIRLFLTDETATLEFEVSVQNSGGAPARDVLIEAALFTASPSQDQEIGAFFAHPKGAGGAVEAIQPLKRMAFTNQVLLTRDQLKLFQVDGKLMFVPVIGFTALYRWSSGNGQSSASYVVGRTTGGDKLAPLRADMGPRVFRNLEARAHSITVRK